MCWTQNTYAFGFAHLYKTYEILVLKTEGKRQLGRPRNRREDNVKMDLVVGCVRV
jgi:hypothetical protein